MVSIIGVQVWRTLPLATVILLGGLSSIPQDIHDAADIDGAGAIQRFRHITLPMISPTMFFNLVLGVIAALKVFTVALIATNGGPAFKQRIASAIGPLIRQLE